MNFLTQTLKTRWVLAVVIIALAVLLLAIFGSGSAENSYLTALVKTLMGATRNASCVSIQAPDSVKSGEKFSASVAMKNTGRGAWSYNNGNKPFRLGSQNPQDNKNWGLNRVELKPVYDPRGPRVTVTPGGTAYFDFQATAPQKTGTYNFDWKMVQDGVAWFGQTCQKKINVTCPSNLPSAEEINRQITSINQEADVKVKTLEQERNAVVADFQNKIRAAKVGLVKRALEKALAAARAQYAAKINAIRAEAVAKVNELKEKLACLPPPPPPPASIKVLSPNGGEKFSVSANGEFSIPFSWSSNNPLGNPWVYLNDYSASVNSPAVASRMLSANTSTGSGTLTQADLISVGGSPLVHNHAYVIKICDQSTSVLNPLCDSSDAPFKITAPAFVQLKINTVPQEMSPNTFITASIKGDPQNKTVDYWKATMSCSPSVAVTGKNDENLCGTKLVLYGNNYFDVTQDNVIWTVSAVNKSDTGGGTVAFNLTAYGAKGNSLGSDKATVFLSAAPTAPIGSLSFSQSSFSATYIQGTPLPSVTNTQYFQSTTFTNTSNVNVNYKISVPNQPAWLNSGYATDQLTATPGQLTGLGAYLNPATVAGTPGTYTTNIIITGNFSGSPKTIPVTLKVTAPTAAGTLNVSLDSVAAYTIVSPGQTVELARLKFSATGEAVALKQIALQLSSPELNTPVDLVNQTVTLWDGATQVGTALFTSGDNTAAMITTFVVPKDGSKVLTVKGVIAGISVSGPLTKSGDLLKVDYDGDNTKSGTYGVGQSSGQTITPSGSDTNSTGVRIMKAYPQVEKVSLPNHTLQSQVGLPLYRFKVTAKNGDISLHKFTFSVSSSTAKDSNATTTRFSLHAFTDSSFSSPDGNFLIESNVGGLINAGNCYNGKSSNNVSASGGGNLGTGSVLPEIYPDKTGCSQSPTTIRISAGESRWFELRASIGMLAPSGTAESLSVQLEGDAAYPTNGMQSAGNVDLDFNDDFIWSPLSTSVTADVFAPDWTNGYGVPGLPSTNMAPETISK